MRAIQFDRPGPLVERDIAEPVAGPGQVVVAVAAAGICHSDGHYRAGRPQPRTRPVTLGHEIAGTIAAVGSGVDAARVGQRVALHYVISCGACRSCAVGREQFCGDYQMLGNSIDGGFAERVAVPAHNAVAIPEAVPTPHAAVMMCSTVTALHALRRGRIRAGDTVAVFGVGGLGQSAVRLAMALGASRVFAIDTDEARLSTAANGGAVPVPAADLRSRSDVVAQVDLAVEMVGSAAVVEDALGVLAAGGRAVTVGLSTGHISVEPYGQMIGRELELIGSNDHTMAEVVEVLDMAFDGVIDLVDVVSTTVPMTGSAINAALDRIDGFGPGIRTVAVPG